MSDFVDNGHEFVNWTFAIFKPFEKIGGVAEKNMKNAADSGSSCENADIHAIRSASVMAIMLSVDLRCVPKLLEGCRISNLGCFKNSHVGVGHKRHVLSKFTDGQRNAELLLRVGEKGFRNLRRLHPLAEPREQEIPGIVGHPRSKKSLPLIEDRTQEHQESNQMAPNNWNGDSGNGFVVAMK